MPEPSYYLILDGKTRTGPFTEELVRTMVAGGTASLETPIWCDGLDDWKTIGELETFGPGLAPPPFDPGAFGNRVKEPAPHDARNTNNTSSAEEVKPHSIADGDEKKEAVVRQSRLDEALRKQTVAAEALLDVTRQIAEFEAAPRDGSISDEMAVQRLEQEKVGLARAEADAAQEAEALATAVGIEAVLAVPVAAPPIASTATTRRGLGPPLDEDIQELDVNTPRKSPSGKVLAAGVLSFFWAAGALLVVLIQILVSLDSWYDGGTRNVLLVAAGWNALIAAVYVAVGVLVLKRKHAGYSWGLGSNVLNFVVTLGEVCFGAGSLFLLLVPIEIAIVVLLYLSRKEFVAPVQTWDIDDD